MKNNYSRFLICALFILIGNIILVHAQNLKVLDINTTQVIPSSPTTVFKARDEVNLLPGANIKAPSNSAYSAIVRIEPTLIIDDNSTGTGGVYQTMPTTLYNYVVDASKTPGKVAGGADVLSNGAAVYNIPIFCSPGSMGMQPSISINYNSQAFNGALGWGWDINGLSAIIREPQNKYFDNKIQGIQFNNTDRFSLDGQRLIVTNNGTYGNDGTQYGTESENFMVITSKSTSGNGPKWFEAKMRDGKILQYGNTSDSRVEPKNSTTASMWRLNRVTDIYGNYMTYTYGETNGESWIQQIDYTGNSINSLPTYNSIVFSYSKRRDQNTLYIGSNNESIDQTVVLEAINVLSEKNVAKTYTFDYFFDQYTKLYKVHEKAADGTEYPPTIIDWFNTPANLLYNQPIDLPFEYSGLDPSFMKVTTGDFDGNGTTDFITNQGDISLSKTANGVVSFDTYHIHSTDYGFIWDNASFEGPIYAVDIDNDGQDEIVVAFVNAPYNTTTHYEFSIDQLTLDPVHGNTVTLSLKNSKAITQADDSYFGDFNGDGNIDRMILGDYNNTYIFTAIDDINTALSMSTTPNFGSGNVIYTLDFNGNGKTDILSINNSNGNNKYSVFEYDETTSSFIALITNKTLPFAGNSYLSPGDFNGDSKMDLYVEAFHTAPSANYSHKIYLSNGTDYVLNSELTNSLDYSYGSITSIDNLNHVIISDMNSDGKTDVLLLNGGSDHYNINITHYFSSGTQFVKKASSETFTAHAIPLLFLLGDLNADGLSDIVSGNYSSTPDLLLIPPGTPAQNLLIQSRDIFYRLVSQVTNGLGERNTFEFKNIHSGDSFYNKDNSYFSTSIKLPFFNLVLPFPFYVGGLLNNIKFPLYCAKYLFASDGLGNLNETSYSYTNAIYNYQGKGFLGFSKIISNNAAQNIQTEKEFSYNDTYKNLIPRNTIITSTIDSKQLSSVTPTYSYVDKSNKRFYLFLGNTLITDDLKVTSKTSAFTDNGNDGTIDVETYTYKSGTTTDGTITNNNSYIVKSSYIYLMTDQTTSSTRNNASGTSSSFSKTLHADFDGNGVPTKLTDFYGTSSALETDYSQRDLYGNITTYDVKADSKTRSTVFTYDPLGRFIINKTDAESYTSSQITEGKLGFITQQTSVDQLISTFKSDGFGRLKNASMPTGQQINVSYAWDDGSVVPNARFTTTKTMDAEPTIITWYDMFGRILKIQGTSLNGDITATSTYNNKGQYATRTYPKYGADVLKSITYLYDNYNRLSTVTDNGQATGYVYTNNSVQITTPNPRSKVYTKTYDSYGDMIQSSGPLSSSSVIEYHGSGQVLNVKGNSTSKTSEYTYYAQDGRLNTANEVGRNHTYSYNGFGELYTDLDDKTQTYTYLYDNIGRITTETGPASDGVKSYQYFDASASPGSSGKLKSVSTLSRGTSSEFTYDAFGRPSSSKETVNGKVFTSGFQFNEFNQLTQRTFPSNFKLTYSYAATGELNQIANPDNIIPNNIPIWTLNNVNALGQPTQHTIYNGVVTNMAYDNYFYPDYTTAIKGTNRLMDLDYNFESSTGNMLSRQNRLGSNLIEYFHNDDLSRLDKITSFSNNQSLVNYYDNRGNILYKYDAGTFTFGNTSKPDRLTAISGNNTLTTPDLIINFNAFDKATDITQNASRVEFTYGADNERRMMISKQNTIDDPITYTETGRTYYIGDYELETDPQGTHFKERHYISSPYGPVTIYIKQNGVGLGTVYGIHTDHLGSVIALSNDAGAVVEEYSYDAWGRKRNPTNWSYTLAAAPTGGSISTRGFTFQEHLEAFGIINMNGRMYDPVMGRFISQDPAVQHLDISSYAYARNNPLSFVDPTGYYDDPAGIEEYYDFTEGEGNSGNKGVNQKVTPNKVTGADGKVRNGTSPTSVKTTSTSNNAPSAVEIPTSEGVNSVGSGGTQNNNNQSTNSPQNEMPSVGGETFIGIGSDGISNIHDDYQTSLLNRRRNMPIMGVVNGNAPSPSRLKIGMKINNGLGIVGYAYNAYSTGKDAIGWYYDNDPNTIRFSYHVSTTSISLLIARSAYGGWAGMAVGMIMSGGELLFDLGAWFGPLFSESIYRTESGLKSGWVPGR